jgi:hypothetical protein
VRPSSLPRGFLFSDPRAGPASVGPVDGPSPVGRAHAHPHTLLPRQQFIVRAPTPMLCSRPSFRFCNDCRSRSLLSSLPILTCSVAHACLCVCRYNVNRSSLQVMVNEFKRGLTLVRGSPTGLHGVIHHAAYLSGSCVRLPPCSRERSSSLMTCFACLCSLNVFHHQ